MNYLLFVNNFEFEFWILQGSVVTYPDEVEIFIHKVFSYESIGERILKSTHICQSYYQTSSGTFFRGSVYLARWRKNVVWSMMKTGDIFAKRQTSLKSEEHFAHL